MTDDLAHALARRVGEPARIQPGGPLASLATPNLGVAVTAGIEDAAFDEDVAARLGVASVVVRTMALDGHATHRHVLAEHRMELPHRRAHDLDVFDEHVSTSVRLDEARAEVVTLAEHA